MIAFSLKNHLGEEKSYEAPANEFLDVCMEFGRSNISGIKLLTQTVTPMEIQLIVPAIPPSLDLLDFSSTNLSSLHVRTLAKRLEHTRIKSLDLSGNRIGDESMWMLSDFFGKNETIRVIRLSNCGITYNGFWVMMSLLQSRPIDFLDVSNNDVGIDGGDLILSMLGNRFNIKSVDITNCGIPEWVIARITVRAPKVVWVY